MAIPFCSALNQWRAAIQDRHVLSSARELEPYRANINGLDREILAVLKPSDTIETQKIVRIANEFRTPLYPLSCGRNWGYGSRLPVRNGAVIVDLSRMNRIRNANQINVADHYALIEPGVTQGQLQSLLHQRGLPLLFNATAAGSQTSILGNSLDRGFGYFAMRPEDISGLEVVLGNGEILRTGYGHYPDAKATYHYRYGLGPSLDGLFFQSNFGIVTCAAFHLIPRRPCHVAILAKLEHDQDFPEFIDSLADLRRQGILESVIHIGSRNRMRITLGPLIYNYLVAQGNAPGPELRKTAEKIVAREKFAAWSAVGGLFGTEREVKECYRAIESRIRRIAKVSTMTPRKLKWASTFLKLFGNSTRGKERRALLQGAKPLMDFSTGTPSDGALLSPLWAIGESPGNEIDNLDSSRVGLLFCCPSIPLNGEVARDVLASVYSVFGRFGFEPFMTLNIVNTKALLLVLNLVFERHDPEKTNQAHRCVDSLFEEWSVKGIYPYRLGIQSMSQFTQEGDTFWEVVRNLKHTFDPHQIISPGRYNLA